MFRKLIMPSLVVILAFAIASCTSPVTPTLIPTSTPTTSADLYPQTHTDALGRKVTIIAKPLRIVSLAPSITETLFAIGAGPQVVGRTKFCNYPPEVISLPEIGGFSAKSISVESVLALEPDLVIAGSHSQKDVVAALEAQGITVFTLAPESLTDIETGIQTLGEITGNLSSAQIVVSSMQSRITAVTTKINTIPLTKRPHIFYEVWHEPLTTTTHNTFIGELLTLAGAVNVFDDLTGPYPEVSAEKILELNPDVIIGPSNHSDQLTSQIISTRPGWDKMAAVKSGAIYIIDADIISRAGPRVADALEAISKLLYPALFGN